MSLVQNIRLKLAENNLRTLFKKATRQRASLNFSEAKTIAILFDATTQENFELVKKYVQYLRDLKKSVKAVGYFNAKELPHFTYSKLEYDFFAQKDLNFNLSPKTNFDKAFLDTDYDILIDLNLNDEFVLRYFATLSKAKFKIGIFSEKNKNIHDLLLNVEKEKGIKYFLKHLDHYLGIINQSPK